MSFALTRGRAGQYQEPMRKYCRKLKQAKIDVEKEEDGAQVSELLARLRREAARCERHPRHRWCRHSLRSS